MSVAPNGTDWPAGCARIMGSCDMYRSGFDYFATATKNVSPRSCRVCGTRCDVRHDVNGPMCWADAVAGRRRVHDQHTCPHAGEGWHDHALTLREEIGRCPSPRVRLLVENDLQELLAEYGFDADG
jgi:hypothetical protein